MSKKIVFLSVFMFFVSLCFAQQREPEMDNQRKMGPPPFFEKLNLTDEQKAKVKQINLNTDESVLPIKCEIENEQIQFKKELVGSPKLESLLSINEKISKLENSIKAEKLKSWYSIYQILNEEQKKIWVESFERNFDRNDMHPKRLKH